MSGRVQHVSALELVLSAAPAGHRWARCCTLLQEQFLCHGLGICDGYAVSSRVRHRFC